MKVPGEKQMSSADVDVHWDVRIPLRDGIHLSALLYRPREPGRQRPAIVTYYGPRQVRGMDRGPAAWVPHPWSFKGIGAG